MNDLLHNKKVLIIGGILLVFITILFGFLSNAAPSTPQQNEEDITGTVENPTTDNPAVDNQGFGASPTPIFTIIDPDKPMFKVVGPH